ncbi:MAG: hypothetical protein KDB46_13065 [Solirubrobacterales bacterium]|nr:hypothetical protein [Solirubrobacterales bacterium]
MGSRLLIRLVIASLFALIALPAAASGHARSGDPVEAIADGGFENSTCHDVDTPYGPLPYCEDPAWTTGDWQASICGQPACAGQAARGTGFLALGGAYMADSNPMTGTVSQTVELPPGPKTLSFAIRVSYENPVTSAVASVEVDGTPVFAMPSGEVSAYATETVDMSGYSGEHEIAFKAECSHGLSMPISWTCDGFAVDDVSLPVARPVPTVRMLASPPRVTERRRVRFAFAGEPAAGTTFECRYDGGAYEACASPMHLRGRPGPHRLRIRAVDTGGGHGPAVLSKWRVRRR